MSKRFQRIPRPIQRSAHGGSQLGAAIIAGTMGIAAMSGFTAMGNGLQANIVESSRAKHAALRVEESDFSPGATTRNFAPPSLTSQSAAGALSFVGDLVRQIPVQRGFLLEAGKVDNLGSVVALDRRLVKTGLLDIVAENHGKSFDLESIENALRSTQTSDPAQWQRWVEAGADDPEGALRPFRDGSLGLETAFANTRALNDEVGEAVLLSADYQPLIDRLHADPGTILARRYLGAYLSSVDGLENALEAEGATLIASFDTPMSDLARAFYTQETDALPWRTGNSRPRTKTWGGQVVKSMSDLLGTRGRVQLDGKTVRIDQAIQQALDAQPNNTAGVITLTVKELGENDSLRRGYAAHNWVKDNDGLISLIDSSDGQMFDPNYLPLGYRNITGARVYATGQLQPNTAAALSQRLNTRRELYTFLARLGYNSQRNFGVGAFRTLVDNNGVDPDVVRQVERAINSGG